MRKVEKAKKKRRSNKGVDGIIDQFLSSEKWARNFDERAQETKRHNKQMEAAAQYNAEAAQYNAEASEKETERHNKEMEAAANDVVKETERHNKEKEVVIKLDEKKKELELKILLFDKYEKLKEKDMSDERIEQLFPDMKEFMEK